MSTTALLAIGLVPLIVGFIVGVIVATFFCASWSADREIQLRSDISALTEASLSVCDSLAQAMRLRDEESSDALERNVSALAKVAARAQRKIEAGHG